MVELSCGVTDELSQLLDMAIDKDYLHHKVSNYEPWDDVQWLLKMYPKIEIKEIIKNPSRGVWFDDVLNFWEIIFDLHIDKEVRQKAIFNIFPH